MMPSMSFHLNTLEINVSETWEIMPRSIDYQINIFNGYRIYYGDTRPFENISQGHLTV